MHEGAMRVASSAVVAAARRSKWAAMAASTWIQCSSGGSYCFAVYSPMLKSSQGYDQSTLDSVAFFKDIGANIGVLSGLLISSRAGHGRTWLVHLAGAAQCFVGYLLMWLSVTGCVPRPPPALMCLYMLLAAHAQTFFNTANVVTAVENFPDSRGTVIGIMKGFLGLSGAILIQIYQTMFDGNPSSFILMLALLPTFLTLLLMPYVKVHHRNGGSEKKFLDAFSLIAVTVAGYLMLVIIGECILRIGSVAHILIFAALMMMLISPAAVVIKAQMIEAKALGESSCHERTRLMEDNLEGAPEERTYDPVAADRTCAQHDPTASNKLACGSGHEPSNGDPILLQRGENFSITQAMSTCDFWLLFSAMACGMGSGLATVNNISQIGGSLGYTSLETSTLVSLWSIWNFLGRFGSGYISDYFLRRKGWARPLFIALTLAVMSVGHAVISTGFPGSLYMGSVLVGICYGSQWSLMPSITSELFGLQHFGTIFNTIAIASPFGSYILSVRVVGYIYDMESSTSSSDIHDCIGRHCFMLSFLIMASVSLFGTVVALILFGRTRRFYEQVIYAKLQSHVQ
ncbi:hypothetical protein C4D60_Mb05t03240 [Musa balbisiana]|uniref:Major facilitator superfamily (MFS) profile domain-containing protein n=1 Tax=Musa balbisiana TaxID=52838 RepID=A0A4S8JTD3_MUSBA|nr:hypothetical protein C4D60_Mb05t03240 [Musa balbisiana]